MTPVLLCLKCPRALRASNSANTMCTELLNYYGRPEGRSGHLQVARSDVLSFIRLHIRTDLVQLNPKP